MNRQQSILDNMYCPYSRIMGTFYIPHTSRVVPLYVIKHTVSDHEVGPSQESCWVRVNKLGCNIKTLTKRGIPQGERSDCMVWTE